MLLRSSIAPLAAFLGGVGVLRASTAVESYVLLMTGLTMLVGAVALWIQVPGQEAREEMVEIRVPAAA